MMKISRDRLIALALIGGYATLLLDIRFEHRRELEDALPWIPIIYSATMVVVGISCIALWSRISARRTLLCGFFGSVIVGMVGVWLHSKGHPVTSFKQVFSVWYSSTDIRRSGPPLLAPMAFAGLGAIGALVTWGKSA